MTVVPAQFLIRHVMELSTSEFISGVAGLIVGLFIGLLLGLPMTNIIAVQLLASDRHHRGHRLGMMGLTVAKRADLYEALKNAGFIRPPERPEVEQVGPTTYVDTSALIDGRMTDVVASGFLFGTLVVPQFVVGGLTHRS